MLNSGLGEQHTQQNKNKNIQITNWKLHLYSTTNFEIGELLEYFRLTKALRSKEAVHYLQFFLRIKKVSKRPFSMNKKKKCFFFRQKPSLSWKNAFSDTNQILRQMIKIQIETNWNEIRSIVPGQKKLTLLTF